MRPIRAAVGPWILDGRGDPRTGIVDQHLDPSGHFDRGVPNRGCGVGMGEVAGYQVYSRAELLGE